MHLPPSVEALRNELRVLSPYPFVAPLIVAAGLIAFAELQRIRHIQHAFTATMLVVMLEACLPLTAGIALASVAVRDNALEVLLTVQTAYRLTTARRAALVLAWVLLLEVAATWVVRALFPGAIPKPGVLGLLAWVAPTLWLAGAAVLLAYLLRSRATSAAVLGCLWVAQLVFHDYFATYGWTQPWFLFATVFVPAAPFWLANRFELVATALVCFLAAWLFLRNAEWRLRAEDA